MIRLLAFLSLAAGLVWAQPAALPSYRDLRYPPMPEVKIPEVATHTLPNGMKLYLLENHELPLIGGFALVRTGNLFDPPGKIGLASITGEVMRTGGARGKSGDELDEQLENIAASVESDIGETSGSVSFNCLKENADEVLAVFRDVLTAPEFRRDKIDLSKTQLRSLIARRNDDAGGIASREFSERMYGRDNPYGWRMEYEHIDRIGREDLAAFHQRYFFPANVILAVQGDFDAAGMKAKLEKLFAGWDAKQPPVPPFPPVTAKAAPGVWVAAKPDVNQTFFRLGHLGGLLKDKDYPALEVMGDILAGGFSSRLFKKVRTELGYAYNVGGSWGANYNHPGVFGISGSTKSQSTTETMEAILKEIDRIRAEEVSEEELRSARDRVLNSFVFFFDSPGKTLNRLVNYDYHGYPKDFIFQYQKAVAAVTGAEILRVARQYLRPRDLTFVAVGKPDDFGRPLDALGQPVHPVDLTIPEPERETARSDDASLARGRELLARVQQALGGADRLASIRDSVSTAEVSIQAPQGAMKVKQTNSWLAPSHFRQDQELPFGKLTAYFDGQQGWLTSPQGPQAMPPPVIQQVRNAQLRNPLRLFLADRIDGWKVNLAEEGVLEISDDSGQSIRVWVDPQTGLPVKQTYQAVQFSGPPAGMQDAYGDWREVGGIRMAFKMSILRDNQPYAEVTVQDVRLNTGLTVEEIGRKP